MEQGKSDFTLVRLKSTVRRRVFCGWKHQRTGQMEDKQSNEEGNAQQFSENRERGEETWPLT